MLETFATDSDADLLRRLRHGEVAAFSALYARTQGPLYRFLLMRTSNPETAADLVQDVFIALMEDKLRFDPTRGPLLNFLFGVARNFALKREEQNGRYTALSRSEDDEEDELILDSAPDAVEQLLSDERAEGVRKALALIAPHYRDVLVLYELHELSYVEIANICGIDLGTVRSRLNRARAKLTAHLQADERTSTAANDTRPTAITPSTTNEPNRARP